MLWLQASVAVKLARISQPSRQQSRQQSSQAAKQHTTACHTTCPHHTHRTVSLLDAVVAHDVQDAHADVITVAASSRKASKCQAGVQAHPGIRVEARLCMWQDNTRKRVQGVEGGEGERRGDGGDCPVSADEGMGGTGQQ